MGFAILQYARLCMLQFFYYCVLKLVPKHEIQTIHEDMDSMHMAVSKQAYHVLKGTAQAKYFKSAEEAARIRAEFFLRTNTSSKIKLADSVIEICLAKNVAQTPGLFKLKCEADGEIALTAKINFIMSVKDNETCDKKVTCKGRQKQRNDEKLMWENYQAALCKIKAIKGENFGFRMGDINMMYTYAIKKKILTPVYSKGVLLNYGIHVRILMPKKIERMVKAEI